MNYETALANESDANILHATEALKTIAHPLRLKIVCVLGSEELCVHDIEEAVGCSQSNVSQHLAILRSHGVLTTRKDANRVLYRINDPRTIKIVSMMGEVFSSHGAGHPGGLS